MQFDALYAYKKKRERKNKNKNRVRVILLAYHDIKWDKLRTMLVSDTKIKNSMGSLLEERTIEL